MKPVLVHVVAKIVLTSHQISPSNANCKPTWATNNLKILKKMDFILIYHFF